MKLNSALLKKIFSVMIILAVAPFAFEVVLLADVAASSLLLLTSSLLLSCMMWLPPLYLSSSLLS